MLVIILHFLSCQELSGVISSYHLYVTIASQLFVSLAIQGEVVVVGQEKKGSLII